MLSGPARERVFARHRHVPRPIVRIAPPRRTGGRAMAVIVRNPMRNGERPVQVVIGKGPLPRAPRGLPTVGNAPLPMPNSGQAAANGPDRPESAPPGLATGANAQRPKQNSDRALANAPSQRASVPPVPVGRMAHHRLAAVVRLPEAVADARVRLPEAVADARAGVRVPAAREGSADAGDRR